MSSHQHQETFASSSRSNSRLDDEAAPARTEQQNHSQSNGLNPHHNHHHAASSSPLELCPPSPLLNHHQDGQQQEELQQQQQQQGQSLSSTSNIDSGRPSNTVLLCTAFVSFMSFSLVQLFFAFLAGSEAMKGDSAAMIVDSLTYLFNWMAELQKNRFDHRHEGDDNVAETNPERAARVRKRQRRKLVLQLEIVPPIISVTTLIGVTIVVLKDAIQVLILDAKRERSEQADPNLHLMMAFSTFNLLLDFVNVLCFARAKHLMGFETSRLPEAHKHRHRQSVQAPTAQRRQSSLLLDRRESSDSAYMKLEHQDEEGEEEPQHDENDGNGVQIDTTETGAGVTRQQSLSRTTSLQEEDDGDEATEEEEEHEKANLNMCSAYTHVFADTLRSVAVIIAALVAELTPKTITSEEADAAAAIAVSVLILLSLIPLFQGLVESSRELYAIYAEEQSENLFLTTEEADDGVAADENGGGNNNNANDDYKPRTTPTTTTIGDIV